jgi:catalase
MSNYKKMSNEQQKQLLDSIDKNVSDAFNRIEIKKHYIGILERAYNKIGKEVMENIQNELKKEIDDMIMIEKIKDI